MRLGSAFWLRFEDSPAPFLRFGSLRFETCVLRLELRFGCVLKTVLHFSCVLKLRLELRFEPLRSAFAFRGTLRVPGGRGCHARPVTFQAPRGAIWGSFGSLLGTFWEPLGGASP